MTVLNFQSSSKNLPLFGVKVPPILHNICSTISEKEIEMLLKKAFKINLERAVKIKEVEDSKGNYGIILIIYDYFENKRRRIKNTIPEKNGYFDFKIFEIDANKYIDIEEIIVNEKRFK